MEEITIIIKTFLREKSLYRLLNSIEKYYSEINVIIVDDGNEDLNLRINKKFNLKINYQKIKYDSGLSYGRNYALKLVKTKYFLLCDDDFVFTEETKIEILKILLEENKADIVGGVIKNKFNYVEGDFKNRIKNLIKTFYKKIEIHNYYGEILNVENELIVKYFNKSTFKDFIATDICLNFFLGKVESIKNTGAWNKDLKIGEHTDFFIRMKENGLKVLTTKLCICDHYSIRTKEYNKYRDRLEEMTKVLFSSRKIARQVSIFPEKNIKNIYYFQNEKLIKEIEEYYEK